MKKSNHVIGGSRTLTCLIVMVLMAALPATASQPDSDAFYSLADREIGLRMEVGQISVGLVGDEKMEKRSSLTIPMGNVELFSQTAGSEGWLLTLGVLPGDAADKNDSLAKQARAEARYQRLDQTIDQLRHQDGVDWAYPAYRSMETGTLLLPTPFIIIQVAPGTPESALAEIGSAYMSRKLRLIDNQYRLRLVNSSDDPMAVANALTKDHSWIEWAEPDFIQQIEFYGLPNDPMVGDQWHVKNTGQGSPAGVVGADARLEQAWNIETGDPNIVIAIIDDGVEWGHEDLASRIFNNTADPVGGGDNDLNGYIDDVRGWDFFSNDNNPNPDLSGPGSHGTSVAGVAAAAGNNGTGVTGACRNCSILPVRISSDSFVGSSVIAEAINYAASFADVLNNSWGGGSPSSVVQAAIDNAVTNGRGGKGAPVLFANGNSASGYIAMTVGWGDTAAGSYVFEWSYAKDGSASAGLDTAFLDNVIFPDWSVEDFESCGTLPGWLWTGDANWETVDDETRSSSSRPGKCAIKAGTITHNQSSTIQYTKWMDPAAGSIIKYDIWASSETTGTGGEGPLTANCYDSTYFYTRFPDGTIVGPLNTLCGTYSNQGNGLMDGQLSSPSSYPATISVGAASNHDRRSDYSQWGPGIDFVAHSGGGSLGVTTVDVTGANGYSSTNYANDFGGTSSATPLAAGITGLLLSKEPNLTAAQVRTRLQQATRKIGTEAYSGGYNTQYGYGALDAFLLLSASSGDEIFSDGFESGSLGAW